MLLLMTLYHAPCLISQNEDDTMAGTRVALTVKDFNYYIGHAYVSLSRLNVNMLANPPRTIRLTAPRRTEMRHMMRQMRRERDAARPRPRGFPMPGEPPSGYVVDISRDNAPGESTRAIVNRSGVVGESSVVGGATGGGGGATGSGGGGAKAEPKVEPMDTTEEAKKPAEGEKSEDSAPPPRRWRDRYNTGVPALGQLMPGIGYEVSIIILQCSVDVATSGDCFELKIMKVSVYVQ